MVNTIYQTMTEKTVTETTMLATGSGAALAAAASGAYSSYANGLPTYPNGLPLNYFDNSGLPLASMNYPYYNPFGHSFSPDLLSDYDVNRQLAAYSYNYNIPSTVLYNMYNLLHSLAPNTPAQNDLNMIQSIAEAYQAERLGYVNNYMRPALKDVRLTEESYKLPPNNLASWLTFPVVLSCLSTT